MVSLRIVLLLTTTLIAVPSQAKVVRSVSQPMSFQKCLLTIRQVASNLGTAPINIVETGNMRVVRFRTKDGSVLVTCSGPDRKMIITQSDFRG